MSLAVKDRFSTTGMRKKLERENYGDYEYFKYNRKKMVVLGPSKNKNLIKAPVPVAKSAKGIKLTQHYACDDEGNMYQFAQQEYKINSKKYCILTAIESVPPK